MYQIRLKSHIVYLELNLIHISLGYHQERPGLQKPQYRVLVKCCCRDAFSFAYDMAELGNEKHTQRRSSAKQGGSGPITWPQNIKETSGGVKFPQQDLKGLNYLDSFLKFCGVVFREPRN